MELTESALLLEVPTAAVALGDLRARYDPGADLGVPAHVTALFPFVGPAAVDPAVHARVTAVARSTAPIELHLTHPAWFGTEVLWAAPEDPEPVRALTAALWAEFPDRPPYGGAYADVVPHLTVAMAGPAVGLDTLRTAEVDLATRLPVRQRVDRVALWFGGPAPGSWRRVREYPLTG